MGSTTSDSVIVTKVPDHQYDRYSELKAFDDSKTGVKGLVDSGVTKIPRIFVNDNDKPRITKSNTSCSFPIIDLKGLDNPATRAEIVKKVKDACDKWGIFQIVNHELPPSVMDEMIQGVRRFNEQDTEVKKQYYTRDVAKKFRFNSNLNLYRLSTAAWKDNFICHMVPNPPDYEELPEVCRDIMFEYSDHVIKVGRTVYELLSEALGLNPSYLKDIGCVDALAVVGNYYPACPEPEVALGAISHVDYGLLTILLQDHIGGLQVLFQDQWLDVPVLPGGLIINVGDFIQIITNDKFKSVRHRALVKKDTARISVATFMTPIVGGDNPQLYGPIKELITEEEPAIYRETTLDDFLNFYHSQSIDGTAKLPHFEL